MNDYGWVILCLPLLAMLAPLILIPIGFLIGFIHEPTGQAILRFANEMAGNSASADDAEGGYSANDTGNQIVEDRQSIARSWGHTSSGGSDWWNQR